MAANGPIKKHGGKSYIKNWIHLLAPPSVLDDQENGYTHRTHAFAGGLGELWDWECEREILTPQGRKKLVGIGEAVNDLDFRLTNLWMVLGNEKLFPLFVKQLELTPMSEAIWHLSAEPSGDPVEDAVRYFVRHRQSWSGQGGQYSTPTTRTRRAMNEQVSAYLSAVEGLPEWHERFRRVEVRNMPAVEFLKKYDHERALHYLDPPYVHSTRTSTGEYGEYEMSDADHMQLLETLTTLQGRWMLSGYPSEMYDTFAAAHGWRCETKEIDNKVSASKTKRTMHECLWMNYPGVIADADAA